LNPEKRKFLPPKVQGGFFCIEILKKLVFLSSGRRGKGRERTTNAGYAVADWD
jgi:hypothetical protein